MILRYLLLSVDNDKVRVYRAQPHPHFTRSFIVDDELIPCDSSDDTDLDFHPSMKEPPSVAEQIAAGENLKPMGNCPPINGLSSSVFAEQFAAAFAAAGRVPAAPAAPASPAEPAEPVASASPAEPVAPAASAE